MKLLMLASLVSSLGLAGNWSGALVDADCYAREERNVTLKAEEVNHDRDFEINQCAPNAKTKSFTVVERNGLSFNLDPQGNAKAAGLIPAAPRKGRIYVDVTGEKSPDTVKVSSISAAR